VSEANLAYIKRRARGGAGLIITEITSIHPSGSAIPNELGAFHDQFIPGLKKLPMPCMLLGQSGYAASSLWAGKPLSSSRKKGHCPSAIRSLVFGLTPREMTHEEIHEIINAFGAAARRGMEAALTLWRSMEPMDIC